MSSSSRLDSSKAESLPSNFVTKQTVPANLRTFIISRSYNTHRLHTCLSGLLVIWPTAVYERSHVQIPPRAVVFITTATAIYSFGHGLHIFTALRRSTQSSTLRGTVSASGLKNDNKWRWYVWKVVVMGCFS